MSNKDPFSNNSDQDQTSEMSDEAAMVIGKARRSFGFSMSIMILGFMAVVLALVYRATRDEKSAADQFALEAINLPASAVVLSIVPVKDVIAVTFKDKGQTVLALLKGKTGEVIKEIPVVKGAAAKALSGK